MGKTTVYLSLGSNVGDRAAALRHGLELLRGLGTITSTSSLYETEPVEVPIEDQQPWYLNCALAIDTDLTPGQFLEKMQAVEQALGRQRHLRHAPRTLDIDILLFGDAVVRTSNLNIPHPGLARRRFVLQPLAEIAPDVRHPTLKKTVNELLVALAPETGAVRKLPIDVNWSR